MKSSDFRTPEESSSEPVQNLISEYASLQALSNIIQFKLIQAKMITVYLFPLNNGPISGCCICEVINTATSI